MSFQRNNIEALRRRALSFFNSFNVHLFSLDKSYWERFIVRYYGHSQKWVKMICVTKLFGCTSAMVDAAEFQRVISVFAKLGTNNWEIFLLITTIMYKSIVLFFLSLSSFIRGELENEQGSIFRSKRQLPFLLGTGKSFLSSNFSITFRFLHWGGVYCFVLQERMALVI